MFAFGYPRRARSSLKCCGLTAAMIWAGGAGLGLAQQAHAQTGQPVVNTAPPTSAWDNWFSGITVQGLVNAGATFNPDGPKYNFGNFLSDHANQANLNQIALTIAKATDPTKAEFQLGFTLEALYGSDARYYHLLGVSDTWISSRYQLIPAQAHIDAHIPVFTKGGMEVQAGILQAPMGVEVLDPSVRPFYTLAYTSEYSVPFEHVGAMFRLHVSDHWDVLWGVDTGNQTTFGRHDNNDEAAGYFGASATGLADGKLALNWLSRIGPEDPIVALGETANRRMRYWNDINAAYTLTPKTTLTAEFNFLHDSGFRAETWSFVTFANYQLNKSWTLNYRGELYRDNTGLFVLNFLTNRAYMQAVAGETVPTQGTGPTTYGDLTLGASWHPDLGHGVRVFQLRPEIRFDRALNGTRAFNDQTDVGAFTISTDAVIGF